MAITVVSLHGRFLAINQATPMVGTVSFTLTGFLQDTQANVIVPPSTTVATLDGSGNFTASLLALDDSFVSPQGLQYQVTENFVGQNNRSYYITLSKNVTSAELSDLVPTTAGSATYVLDGTPAGTYVSAAGAPQLITSKHEFTAAPFFKAVANGDVAQFLDPTGAASGSINTPGGANFGLGASALGAVIVGSTTGLQNTAIGQGTLSALTGGNLNTAIGLNAGGAITNGFQQVAIGANALQHSTGNTTGGTGQELSTNNTAVGANSMQQLTTGHRNVGIGVDTLFTETTGKHNTAVGTHALNTQNGVDGNTAVGYATLFSNVSGTANTAVGDQALNLITSSQNTVVGSTAMNAATTGGNITAMGYGAGSFPNANFANRTTTGGFQTAIGSQTGQASATPGDYGTALGYVAIYDSTAATALGAFSQALHSTAVALGYGSVTTAAGQVQMSTRHVELKEITDPGVGGLDTARWYCRDNGAGKTQLCVQFATGAVQVLATQP